MKLFDSVVMFMLSLFFAASAFAAANVSMVSDDGKSWTLQASDFENISGIDLTITYDPSILSNPNVTQGSFVAGSMMVPNADVAGVVRIGIVTAKPLTGSGPIATVTFQRKASGSAKLKLAAKIVNKDLAPTPVIPVSPTDSEAEATDTSSGRKANQQVQTPQQSGNQSQSNGSSTVVVGGHVTLPSDMTASTEEKKAQQTTPEYREEQQREAPSVHRPTSAPEAKQEAEAKASALKIEPPENILGRFNGYKGEMTSKALIQLFAVDEKATVKQDPPILLADGKANLKLTVRNPQGKHAPNFALKKAKLVSLKVASNNTWVVVAKPEKGVYDASITMLVDDTAVEMPLTVAPKVDIDLDKSGKIDDNDFKIFLKDRGSNKAPKHDLDKDGRRNHIDDYIFTANFLVLNQIANEKPMAGKVPVETKQKSDTVRGSSKPQAK
ncbi:hypothetical protein Geob_2656 [Geotalea daltonii FRC-32]|uniref:EF-hand domain-containing protein n=1 Tax=Geotalea daltonii (strain DSM 22248 / JCM 15807 / FRC-32) TaxID=316067 RepID=B9M1C4_GEODF|nr:cohesin domain-containing protein [Geotalea daltonii]ACM21006.1 hypothetical protein Geob_2656 [Geotalea daltonii FRC-32]